MFKAKTRNNIATLLEKHGRRKEALKNMKSTLETLREHLPPTHPEIAASYNNIGTFYYEMEDYPNALLNYEKCRDIQQASLPSQHPDLARTNLYMKRTMAIIQQRERTSTEVRNLVPEKFGKIQ
jgi:tetratricopeptide (TPR) repeat protein